jgi:hypothetical protein
MGDRLDIMPAPRSSRILRRALIAVAIPAFLLASYISAWLAVSWTTQQGIIRRTTASQVAPAFKPVMWYCGRPLPGSHLLSDLWWVLNPLYIEAPGEGFDYPLSMSLAPYPEEGFHVSIPAHAIRRAQREAERRSGAAPRTDDR